MTERQKRFAEYYLETGNARQSALKAGYSAGYAEHVKRQKGVKEYIDMRIGSMDNRRVASADEVLEFLTDVMRGQETDEKGVSLRMKAAEMISEAGVTETSKIRVLMPFSRSLTARISAAFSVLP